MKEKEKKYIALWQVMLRECRRLVSRPLYLFCMVIAPLFCYIFFTTLMSSGLPEGLPAGVVDMDCSANSRNIIRNLDAFTQTDITAHYSNIADARIALQKGEIYGFFYIPKVCRQRRKANGSLRSLSIQTTLISLPALCFSEI